MTLVGLLSTAVLVSACGSDSSDSSDSSSGRTAGNGTSTSASGGSEATLTKEAQEVATQATEQLLYATVEVPTEPGQVEPYGKWRGPDSAPEHEAGKTVELIVCTKTSPACMGAAEASVQAAEVLGWKADIIDGGGTPQGFSKAFNTAFSRNPDAIIGIAVPSELVGASLEEAEQKDILTMAVGDKEPSSGTKYQSYVPFPMPAMTAVLGWSMIAESEGDANVVAINDPGYPVLVQSLEAMEGVLAGCADCSVTRVNQQITEAADPSKVNANIRGALANDPEANYLYTPYSIPLAALIQTVQSSGKADSVKIVAKDGDEPELKAVAEGTVALTVGSSVEWAGWASIDQVIRGLAGEPFLDPTETGLGIAAFTKANVPTGGSIEEWPGMVDYRKEYERIWGA